MGRAPRMHAPGSVYHVTLRGNHAARIFDCARNYEVMSEIVGDVLQAGGAVAHAYCWMTNHIHLLLQVDQVRSSELMHDIGGRYSRYLQGGRGTRGQLFDRRYFAQLVDDDSYLVAAACYIHLNPVRAGLVSGPRDYPWSGHCAYLGIRPGPAWLRTRLVFGALTGSVDQARAAYCARTEAPDAGAMPSPFRRREALQAARTKAGRQSPGVEVAALLAAACRARGLAPEVLRDCRGNAAAARVRAEITTELVATHKLTITALARELGCSVVALSRANRQS